MIRVFVPSLLGWIASLGVMAVFLAAYDIPVSFDTLMKISGGNSIANVTSVTPGGAGVNQAFNVASLSGVTDATTATAYSVAQQLVTTAWNIIFAMIVLVFAFGWTGGKALVGTLVRRGEGEGGRAEGRARRAKEGQEGSRARGRLSAALIGLDRPRARPRLARGDALADDADVLDLTLVLSARPLRTGFWFYLGAFGATLGIGVVAAFVLGTALRRRILRRRRRGSPILDVVAGRGAARVDDPPAAAAARSEARGER